MEEGGQNQETCKRPADALLSDFALAAGLTLSSFCSKGR